MTLYEELKAAGIETDSHESDLYAPDTPEVVAILARYPTENKTSRAFVNQIDKKLWFDIPFAFTPFWQAKAGGGRYQARSRRNREEGNPETHSARQGYGAGPGDCEQGI